ncbi:FHA domain-containing protein [Massilia pseudoviolaceinigra]|uniref:FHA domain-containing protein n=1 Tax=Massilia pseudoviolaceinigra TaxID=3057165 RepID=UPI002796AA38|nr:FHA domain-containing protein [Massilia sp. CCM 9206]MDQ1924961.1 FHA domain-containing protein [Massilia sp. CCM 9206]
MAKIIISRDHAVIREVELDKDRMTLGRRPDSDIVLPHPAMSGAHAAFTFILDDVFLEDLGSTNGTYVNGRRVAKHMLEDHDTIVVARFQLEFMAGPRRAAPEAHAVEVSMVASIEVKTGPNAGKRLVLTKPLSTLGKPGVQVVAITRQNGAYYLAHVDGSVAPLINGVAPGKTARRLQHGDAIELAGADMVFCLTPE